MGIHTVHMFHFCYQDSRLFGDLSCFLHLGHQLNVYVFISTSFVSIAFTVSGCTPRKYSSISVDCHNDLGGQLLATLVMLIRLQDTVVNASACIRTVCVCELCTCVCCVRLQCLSG